MEPKRFEAKEVKGVLDLRNSHTEDAGKTGT
jgi:hypothetical protein